MTRRFLATLLILGGALGAAGCQCGAGEEPTDPVVVEPPAPPTGTIEGVVRLVDGAELPHWPTSTVSIAGRPALPDTCTPPQQRDATPVTAAPSGGLINVGVTAMGVTTEGWPTGGEPRTHDLTIRDCRLTPSTIVATVGDRLRVSNETNYPFFPNVGEGMMQALLRDEPRDVTIGAAGARTVECSLTAPCGMAVVMAVHHPVHTVSGADGRFRIENVPAGREVRVVAFHPLLRDGEARLTVGAGETATVELRVTPAPQQPAEPPPAEEPTGEPALD